MGGCDDDVRKLIIVSPPERPPPSSRARAISLALFLFYLLSSAAGFESISVLKSLLCCG